jgi:hypothetical protein
MHVAQSADILDWPCRFTVRASTSLPARSAFETLLANATRVHTERARS